jgi:hypothetical protein
MITNRKAYQTQAHTRTSLALEFLPPPFLPQPFIILGLSGAMSSILHVLRAAVLLSVFTLAARCSQRVLNVCVRVFHLPPLRY